MVEDFEEFNVFVDGFFIFEVELQGDFVFFDCFLYFFNVFYKFKVIVFVDVFEEGV